MARNKQHFDNLQPIVDKDGRPNKYFLRQMQENNTEEGNIYNILDFGGSGNGKKDNCSAFREAISTIKRAGGGVLYFPSGVYVLNCSITIDADSVVLKGDARWGRDTGTIIKHTSDLADPLITFAAAENESTSNGCGVFYIGFMSGDNDRAYTCPAAVYVEAADHFTVDGLFASNFNGSALKLKRSVQSHFSNVTAFMCGSVGNPPIHLEASGGVVQNSAFYNFRVEVGHGGEPFIHIENATHTQNKWFGIGCETDPITGEDTDGQYLLCESDFNQFFGLSGNTASSGGTNPKFQINANRITIDGVQGAGVARGALVAMTGSFHNISNVLYTGDGVTGGDKYAVHVVSGSQAVITNVTAQNGRAVLISDGAVGTSVSNVNGSNSTTHAVYNDGLRCQIEGGTLDDTDIGVHFGPNSQDCKATDLTISNMPGPAIYVDGVSSARHQIHDNRIYGITSEGIHVIADTNLCSINNNYIIATTEHAILVEDSTVTSISNNVILEASTTNAGTYSGIRLLSTGADFLEGGVLCGNKFDGTDVKFDLEIDDEYGYLNIVSNNARSGKNMSSILVGGNNVFAGNIGIPFEPNALFAAGEQGLWYDIQDISTMFSDSSGTVPAVVNGVVGFILDKSGRGNHASQAGGTNKPILRRTGSLYYLDFDGTDDGLVTTATVDFTGTDAITVHAGLEKESDAAAAAVVELGVPSGAGYFFLNAPGSAADNFHWRSRGTSSSDVAPTGFAAPYKAVLTGLGDISADSSRLRVNSVEQTPNAADQGTGNFQNAVLNIGRRNAASNPFNGKLFGLIVRGALSSATEISLTENWLNDRTQAY